MQSVGLALLPVLFFVFNSTRLWESDGQECQSSSAMCEQRDMAPRMNSPKNLLAGSGTSILSNAPPRLVLPHEHGSILSAPDGKTAVEWIGLNRARLDANPCDVQGMPLSRLRAWAREALLEEAVRFTSSLRNVNVSQSVSRIGSLAAAGPLVVTGHQPELFHAGVWAKNFAAAGLARRCEGVALNLIVDNDTLDSVRLRVPVGSPSAPRIERLAFDADRPAQPWEEATVVDRKLFREFGARVTSLLRENWSFTPLIEQCWLSAVRHLEDSRGLCDCLTAARVAAERSYGCQNLELPMSRVCDTAPFRHFAAHLLAHLPRVHSVYNAAVREYRREHRLRNASHPVPDLATQDDWLEAPFWIWRVGDQQRDRPFVRRVGSHLELRDSRAVLARWIQTEAGSTEESVATLADFARQGLRFRTRALTTTLFARLCLADMFLHGIGGAKYDAMTDLICEQLFSVTAPHFATVSATFHLPLGTTSPTNSVTDEQFRRRIRDLRFNPDRHITPPFGSINVALVDEKRSLIESLASRRPTASETRRIEEINAALVPSTREQERLWQSEREAARQRRAVESIQRDREFAWCLYSGEELAAKLRAAFDVG